VHASQSALANTIAEQNAAIDTMIGEVSALRQKQAAVEAELAEKQDELERATAALEKEKAHLEEVRAELGRALGLITAGEPLYSFTATRDRVDTLERQTGALDLVRDGPHRLADVMQPAGLLAAGAGLFLGLLLMRKRVVTGLAATLLAGAAFAFLACAGLAVIARYTMLASAILCVFAALALLGWRLLDRGDPWRRRWQLVAALLALLALVGAPRLHEFVETGTDDVELQSQVQDDLYELVEGRRFDPACGPIAVASDRAIPRLASRLDLPPSTIVLTPPSPQPRRGYFFRPASAGARLHYGTVPAPPRFREVARNESWRLYERCG
jgi:hypothetical protein